MKRRGFVKLCATAVASVTASPELLARENQQY
ncbi:MAG: twin-arginine translocation signal domain-containing protein, partial [Gammaproteobacteria bacterium]